MSLYDEARAVRCDTICALDWKRQRPTSTGAAGGPLVSCRTTARAQLERRAAHVRGSRSCRLR